LLLFRDIGNDLREVGLADREVRITALPLKIQVLAALLLEPQVGHPLYFFHPLRLGNCASETAQ